MAIVVELYDGVLRVTCNAREVRMQFFGMVLPGHGILCIANSLIVVICFVGTYDAYSRRRSLRYYYIVSHIEMRID